MVLISSHSGKKVEEEREDEHMYVLPPPPTLFTTFTSHITDGADEAMHVIVVENAAALELQI